MPPSFYYYSHCWVGSPLNSAAPKRYPNWRHSSSHGPLILPKGQKLRVKFKKNFYSNLRIIFIFIIIYIHICWNKIFDLYFKKFSMNSLLLYFTNTSDCNRLEIFKNLSFITKVMRSLKSAYLKWTQLCQISAGSLRWSPLSAGQSLRSLTLYLQVLLDLAPRLLLYSRTSHPVHLPHWTMWKCLGRVTDRDRWVESVTDGAGLGKSSLVHLL